MKVDKKKIVCSMLDAGMNNKQLSNTSGVSIARISNIRNGGDTTYESLSKIAKALGVHVIDLVVDDDAQIMANTAK